MVKGENMKVIEKRKNGSIRVYTVNNEPSMTDQQGLNKLWSRSTRYRFLY